MDSKAMEAAQEIYWGPDWPQSYWPDLDGLEYEEKEEIIGTAAIISKHFPPSVPVSVIEHWREYWNGDRNEGAMWDALNYLMDDMDYEIAKAKEQA